MNCVDIIGVLRDCIDEKFRYFEYEVPYTDDYDAKDHLIVVRDWTNLNGANFIKIAAGTKVAIHGHLDINEKFGTIIIAEQVQTLK